MVTPLPEPYPRFSSLSSSSTLMEVEAAWRERCGAIYKSSQYQGQLRSVEAYIVSRNVSLLNKDVGLRIFINTEIARDWYDKETYYSELREFVKFGAHLVRPGDTVFDCGAHHGVYSMVFADAVGPSGRVIAFEPVPINAQLARLNADINGYLNIIVQPLGLGARDEKIAASMQAHSTSPEANKKQGDTVEMQITTLDRFADYKPDFVKIDVEGAEVDTLIGAKGILRAKPKVLISVHPPFMTSFNHVPREIFKHISRDDYDCLLLYPGKPIQPYRDDIEMDTFCELLFLPK